MKRKGPRTPVAAGLAVRDLPLSDRTTAALGVPKVDLVTALKVDLSMDGKDALLFEARHEAKPSKTLTAYYRDSLGRTEAPTKASWAAAGEPAQACSTSSG